MYCTFIWPLCFYSDICPDDGVLPWYYYDGQCWLFPPHDEKVPFQAAKDKCQEGNPLSHLVSIHSERDNSIVQSVVEYDNMWTGLMIDGKDNYHWDDGTPVDYQAWKEGGMYYVMMSRRRLFKHFWNNQ